MFPILPTSALRPSFGRQPTYLRFLRRQPSGPPKPSLSIVFPIAPRFPLQNPIGFRRRPRPRPNRRQDPLPRTGHPRRGRVHCPIPRCSRRVPRAQLPRSLPTGDLGATVPALAVGSSSTSTLLPRRRRRAKPAPWAAAGSPSPLVRRAALGTSSNGGRGRRLTLAQDGTALARRCRAWLRRGDRYGGA
jgi:hypothetical protein